MGTHFDWVPMQDITLLWSRSRSLGAVPERFEGSRCRRKLERLDLANQRTTVKFVSDEIFGVDIERCAGADGAISYWPKSPDYQQLAYTFFCTAVVRDATPSVAVTSISLRNNCSLWTIYRCLMIWFLRNILRLCFQDHSVLA